MENYARLLLHKVEEYYKKVEEYCRKIEGYYSIGSSEKLINFYFYNLFFALNPGFPPPRE